MLSLMVNYKEKPSLTGSVVWIVRWFSVCVGHISLVITGFVVRAGFTRPTAKPAHERTRASSVQGNQCPVTLSDICLL
jgi:hypothetical protein